MTACVALSFYAAPALSAEKAESVLTASPIMAAPVAESATSSQVLQSIKPPEPTSPGYIALVFNRLTGQKPDFSAWVMASDDYRNAVAFDRDLVMREKTAELEKSYQLIMSETQLIIRHPIRLLPYSRVKRGFFVENFRPDTFYAVNFLDRNYAIIPQDLMNYQWLGVEDPKQMDAMQAYVGKGENDLVMMMYITATSADAKEPFIHKDKKYWLMSGKIARIQIFDSRGEYLLWDNLSREESEKVQQEVLDLYR
jgi:hypothetical protein